MMWSNARPTKLIESLRSDPTSTICEGGAADCSGRSLMAPVMCERLNRGAMLLPPSLGVNLPVAASANPRFNGLRLPLRVPWRGGPHTKILKCEGAARIGCQIGHVYSPSLVDVV